MTVERACLLSHVQYTISELNALEAIFFQVKENSLFQNFFWGITDKNSSGCAVNVYANICTCN